MARLRLEIAIFTTLMRIWLTRQMGFTWGLLLRRDGAEWRAITYNLCENLTIFFFTSGTYFSLPSSTVIINSYLLLLPGSFTFCLTGLFLLRSLQVRSGSSMSLKSSTFGDFWKKIFLQNGCCSCHPTNTVEAIKGQRQSNCLNSNCFT